MKNQKQGKRFMKLRQVMTALGVGLMTAAPALATGPIKAPTAEQMATMVNKGDTSWILISDRKSVV